MQTKKNISLIFAAVMAASLLVMGGLSAQDVETRPEGACKKCRTDFQACRAKAKTDFAGKEKADERRKAILACKETKMTCIAPCKDCKTSCKATKKEGKTQCRVDFDPKTICEAGDKECSTAIKSERKSCVEGFKATNCNDQCRVN